MSSKPKGYVPPHGTPSRYANHGCRCDECRAENTEKLRAWRHAKKQLSPWGVY